MIILLLIIECFNGTKFLSLIICILFSDNFYLVFKFSPSYNLLYIYNFY